MPQNKNEMPLNNKLDMMLKLHDLETQGKKKEATLLKRQIPLPAYLAKFAKDHKHIALPKPHSLRIKKTV